MHYATIKWTDIANGEGVRISLFVSGCTHRCKNCFNEIAWDFEYGQPFESRTAEKILEELIDTTFEGWEDHYTGCALNAEGECVTVDEIKDIARHFFHLGIKHRKEE